MQETTYIFSNGVLKRKDNTLFFQTEEGVKKFIPIENIKEIFIYGEVTINKKILDFLSQKEIILSYFNYYGYYMGSFYPREHYNSGYMIVKQVEAYSSKHKRLLIAQKFVTGASKNCLKIIKYYHRRGKDMRKAIKSIESLLPKIDTQDSIENLMAIEGGIKKTYYACINTIINNPKFHFEKRTKKPPKDFINTMISFTNTLIYNYILSEIYKTHLDPRIGFLHTSNFRKFSLNLDVAEIFKPIIGDRAIFSAINKEIISENDFQQEFHGILLKNTAKIKYLEFIEERLKHTIKHSTLNRSVSYRRLMRLELYKLEKHLLGEEEYKPFIMDW